VVGSSCIMLLSIFRLVCRIGMMSGLGWFSWMLVVVVMGVWILIGCICMLCVVLYVSRVMSLLVSCWKVGELMYLCLVVM